MNNTAVIENPVDFGALLRDWRQHRRLSQLALSSCSGISQRHISFLETGRSRPSRGTVLALAESLDVPLRERNTLLHCAGYAAMYSEQPLTGQATEVFARALQATLDHQEPFPALVLDGRWNLIMANQGALRFFNEFINVGEALEELHASEFQVVRLCLSEQALRPYISNWHELAYAFLQRARRALLINPRDPLLPVLIEEITGHPEAPTQWRAPDWSTPPAPAISMVLEKDGHRYALFTMLAHFGAARNVTLEELSVELFYPADTATRERLLALAD